MLIDERIEELTEKGAKQLLRGALEEIAGRLSCETCAMHVVCWEEASEDDCMRQVLVMLAVPRQDETEEDEETDEPDGDVTIRYNPETMKIEEQEKRLTLGVRRLEKFQHNHYIPLRRNFQWTSM